MLMLRLFYCPDWVTRPFRRLSSSLHRLCSVCGTWGDCGGCGLVLLNSLLRELLEHCKQVLVEAIVERTHVFPCWVRLFRLFCACKKLRDLIDLI